MYASEAVLSDSGKPTAGVGILVDESIGSTKVQCATLDRPACAGRILSLIHISEPTRLALI
eukprot:5363948-Alexandrium_andersonii.AAC.1